MTDNPFNIANGYKLSLQKRIVLSGNRPYRYEDGNGTTVDLNRFSDKYAFDDGSYRFIRTVTDEGNTEYVLENPDYSTETFNSDGNIVSIKDKYDNNILTYEYFTEYPKMLKQISYKNTAKTINLSYSGSTLQSIQYKIGTEVVAAITLEHSSSSHIIVHHYSGVDYSLTGSSESYIAESTNLDESYSNEFSQKIQVTKSNSTITFEKSIGNKVIDNTVYSFVNCDSSGKARILDVTNFQNVTTRVQFSNGKPAYSYELLSTMFVTHPATNDPYYPGGVTFYNNDQSVGSQRYGDGSPMKCQTLVSGSNPNDFDALHNFSGIMTVSGWLQSKADAVTEGTIIINHNNAPIASYTIKGLVKDTWMYFSASFYLENTTTSAIKVLTLETTDRLWAQDLRLSGNAISLIDEDIANLQEYKDNMANAAGVLLHRTINGSENVIRLADESVEFLDGSTLISKADYPMTANDLMRFKINQLSGKHTDEAYYNDGRGILSLSGVLNVRYLAVGSTTTVGLEDLSVGNVYSKKGNTFVTKTDVYVDSSGISTLKTQSSKNGAYYKTDVVDNKLDPVSSTTDGVTTAYTRNSVGLVTGQTVSSSASNEPMTTSAAYTSDGLFLSSTTDEFGITTEYETDTTWGVVKKTTVVEEATKNTSVSDTFDSDYSTQKTRTFSKKVDSAETSKTHTFSYTNGNLSKITDDNLTYQFTYDRGDLTSVDKNGIVENHSISPDRRTILSTYGTYSVTENYDKYGRPISIDGKIENTYDVEPYFDANDFTFRKRDVDNSAGKLAMVRDLTTSKTYKYCYEKDSVTKIGTFNSSGTQLGMEFFNYDDINRLTAHNYTYDMSNSKSVRGDITYAIAADSPLADNRISVYSYKINGTEKAKTQNRYNDPYKRLSAKLITVGSTTYDKGITYSKTRISKVMDVKNGSTFHNVSYTYDALGRITDEVDSADTSFNNHYEYDAFGQLIRENNKSLDKTYVYEYNESGNIKSAKTYTYTTDSVANLTATSTESYVYDSTVKDRLKSFNNSSISYDSSGYPTYYNNRNYTWTKGKLTRIHRGSSMQYGSLYEYCNFAYDGYGRRTSKSYSYDPNPGSTSDYSYMYTTTYDYDTSGRIVHETCVERYISGTTTNRDILYLYDESGIIGAIQKYNSTEEIFYFDKNIKGDVIGIYNASGTKIANYSYDSWGNCTTKTLVANNFSAYNPIRYRGYYYDREIKLYYLNARYYDPAWRRFISPDNTAYLDPDTPGGLKLYAYCNNDPVNYSDPSGNLAIPAFVTAMFIGFGVGFALGGIFETGKQIKNNGWDPSNWDGIQILLSALGGGVAGAISAMMPKANYFVTFILGGIGSVLGGFISGSVNSFGTAVQAFLIGGAANIFGKWVSDQIKYFDAVEIKARSISKMGAKKKSLAIWKMLGTDKSMRNAYKDWTYELIFDVVLEQPISQHLISGLNDLSKYMVYSSLTSTLCSGWY
jgi:RHS repeat-associated protein